MAKRQRSTLEEMRRRIEEWKASGLGLREWSEQQGLRYETALRWRQRVRKLESGTKSSGFSPVRVSPSPSSDPVIVELGNGLRLRMPIRFDSRELVRLVQALREC